MLMSWRAGGLLFVLAVSAAVAAAQSPQSPWQTVGQIGGPTQAVAIKGNYAYLGVGPRLIVLDVSDPTAPREVGGSAPFSGAVQDVAVSGTIAYVAAGGGGLRVLDVSDPTLPAEIGSVHSRGYAEGVAVSGTTVGLADGPYGLRVIDVSNPANPTEIGSAFTRNYAFKVAIAGSYAYVAAAGAGLLIVDLTNPAKPLQVATLATPGYAYGLTVTGNTVYVASGWGGLAIVDVATKAVPRLLGQYQTEGWAKGVSVLGNQACVAAALGGLVVLDVSNPAAPVEVGSLAVVGGDAAGVAVAGAIAYVADRNWGLEAVSLSAPANPVQVGFYGPLGYAEGVAVAGNYAYVAAGSYGLRIVDISDPAHPRQVGAYDTQSYTKSVAVAGNYAYVGTYQNFQVVDVSDPSHPVKAGLLSDSLLTRGMAFTGGVVYIADEQGLWLIDVSDPSAPKKLSHLQTETSNGQNPAVGVAVSGNVAYVALEGQGLLTVDVSNPLAPAVIGQLQWPNAGAEAVAVAQGMAFVADRDDVTVVDVSNPRTPVWLASYPIPGYGAWNLTLAGDQVFVASGGVGLFVLDVSNPASPVLDWSSGTPGSAESVFVVGDRAYVGASLGGLLVLGGPQGHSQASARKVWTTLKVAPPRVRTRVKPAVSARALSVQAASSCAVISTADSGAGTLRDCLMNASSGTTITFDTTVFPPSHPATIAPLSFLPSLAQGNLTIDASNAGVILDGGSAQAFFAGLDIASDNNSIKGLQIVHFPLAGILVSANNNLIGGSRSRGSGPLGEGNLISGNGFAGIEMGPSAANTTITGNLIGTDIAGTAAMGNGSVGIIVSGSPNTRIGGSSPEERNVISGNTGAGIGFNASCGGNCANVIIGNYIGVDVSGTNALANSGDGIDFYEGANGSLVQGNVMVSNSGCIGMYDWGSSYNAVVGNLLGTDASGKVALGSMQFAISVGGGAWFNRIGGTAPADRNVIAQGGISLAGAGNLAIGNFIGTDISGSRVLAQSGSGVGLGGDTYSRSFIGGTTAGERNVISGNPDGGIKVGIAAEDFIGGNYIGTDASGQIALGNGDAAAGVQISQGTHTIVQGNLIAHQQPGAGVTVSGYNRNTIRQNLIYDSPAGGIVLSDGGNAGISPPVIASVIATGVSGTACPGCEVEIFSDSDGQGRIFEGSAVASASGAFTFDEGTPLTGPNITATSTDGDGNTSAFSASSTALPLPPNAPSVIAVTPSTLQFAYTLQGPTPAGQPIQVTKTGGGALDWSATSSAPWLSLAPASDMTPSAPAVSISPGNQIAGTYDGTITISSAGLASQTVAVSLTVYGAPAAPVLRSPANGATGVVTAPVLAWNASPGAASYEVHFGTSPMPPVSGTTAGVSYSAGALNPNTVYYWQIVAQNSAGSAASAVWSFTTGSPATGLHFVPVAPCRLADTRYTSIIAGDSSSDFAVPQLGCGIPSTAQAYSLNITAVPSGYLGYLTIWPSGQPQPNASTLNSWQGIVVANAVIVPAGANGAVSVYVSNDSDVILDINGYFDTSNGPASFSFYPATPCRVVDTRGAAGQFGGPELDGTNSRDFPIPLSSCSITAAARGYSLNFTVVPSGYLGFLTTWPTGEPRPNASTLNSWAGKVVANAAIVPGGTNESVSAYGSNATQLIMDINGYFGQPGSAGALTFYPVAPCRVVDTRNPTGAFGAPEMEGPTTRVFPIPASGCNIPSTAAAYSLNVTVVPDGLLSYLTIWPDGSAQPNVSTLNSFDGSVVANAAIVPAGTNGAISIYVTNPTHVILDINGYFAP